MQTLPPLISSLQIWLCGACAFCTSCEELGMQVQAARNPAPDKFCETDGVGQPFLSWTCISRSGCYLKVNCFAYVPKEKENTISKELCNKNEKIKTIASTRSNWNYRCVKFSGARIKREFSKFVGRLFTLATKQQFNLTEAEICRVVNTSVSATDLAREINTSAEANFAHMARFHESCPQV